MGRLSLLLVISVFCYTSLAQAQFPPLAAKLHMTLLLDARGGTDRRGALFIIDPATGERRLLSDFGDARCAQPDKTKCFGNVIAGVAMDALGRILVVDLGAGIDHRGALFTVIPTGERAGERSLLSDFGKLAQGPLGQNPGGIATLPSGGIVVIDPDAGTESPTEN